MGLKRRTGGARSHTTRSCAVSRRASFAGERAAENRPERP
jgi:hypothetical protein